MQRISFSLSSVSLSSVALAALVVSGAVALGLGCEVPPVEICGNGLDDDENGASDCNDDACVELAECAVLGECVVDLNFPERDATTAEPLELATEVQGTLCPQFDDDGYAIDVGANGSIILVTLTMETNITQVEPGYGILRDNGTALADPTGITARDPQRTPGEPVNFTGAHRLEEAGTYIVVVSDIEALGAFDNINKYTLTVDVVPDPDPNEPNNNVAQAAPLAAGTTTGIIATSGDQDWFKIANPGAGQIIDATISVSDQAGVEHVATLFAPDGITQLQSVVLAPGATAGVLEGRLRKSSTTDIAGTDFYLQIVDAGEDGNQDSQLDTNLGNYTITLALPADPDPAEAGTGNEDFVTAVAVGAAGGSFDGALATIADNDVFRVTPPAGTTENAPRVMIVTVSFTNATFDDAFEPQLRVASVDPNPGAQIPACNPAATPPVGCPVGAPLCLSDNRCGEARLQRFINRANFVAGFPLRNSDAVFIEVNEFGDNGFQEVGDTYTLDIEFVADPDPVTDEVLVPNLEEAGYQNDNELNAQRGDSIQRGRIPQLTAGQLAACDPAVAPTGVGCLDLRTVTNAVGFDFPADVIDCSDPEVSSVTRTLTGQLTYEGDRDFFTIGGISQPGYFAVQFDYSMSAATPIELALFMHTNSGLGASTLRATETGNCDEFDCNANGCGQDACDSGSICVDRRCWTDGLNNAGGNFEFGPFTPQPNARCAIAGPRNAPPLLIEIVDNGINDFDLGMTYSVDVTIQCGCPAACDNGEDYCQDGL